MRKTLIILSFLSLSGIFSESALARNVNDDSSTVIQSSVDVSNSLLVSNDFSDTLLAGKDRPWWMWGENSGIQIAIDLYELFQGNLI